MGFVVFGDKVNPPTIQPTVLPPRDELKRTRQLEFDPHAFAGRKRGKRLAKELVTSGMDGGYLIKRGGGHIESGHTGRQWNRIPAFVASPAKLRQVLLVLAYSRWNHRRHVLQQDAADPEAGLTDTELLARLTIELDLQNALMENEQLHSFFWQRLTESIRDEQSVGGFCALAAAIVFRAYRLRWHDDEISSEMNLPMRKVAKILRSVRQIAKSLGFDVDGGKDTGTRAEPAKVLELFKQGKSTYVIAKELKCGTEQVKIVLCQAGKIFWQLPKFVPGRLPRRGRANPENLAMLWSMGCSRTEIMEALQCSQIYYFQALRALDTWSQKGGDPHARERAREKFVDDGGLNLKMFEEQNASCASD